MTTGTTLLTLLSVAVGGAIGFASSWLIEWIKEKKERRNKRAEKLEELVSAVYEFDHYLDRYRSVTAYGNPGEEGLSPMSKMEGIATVYFPEFLKTIAEVSIAAHGYQAAIAGAGQKRLAGKIAETNDGLIEAREPYAQKRNELLKELREFARKEINQRRRA